MSGNWKEAATMGLEMAVNIAESYMDFVDDVLNGKCGTDLEEDAKVRRSRWLPILVGMRNKLNELKGVAGNNK